MLVLAALLAGCGDDESSAGADDAPGRAVGRSRRRSAVHRLAERQPVGRHAADGHEHGPVQDPGGRRQARQGHGRADARRRAPGRCPRRWWRSSSARTSWSAPGIRAAIRGSRPRSASSAPATRGARGSPCPSSARPTSTRSRSRATCWWRRCSGSRRCCVSRDDGKNFEPRVAPMALVDLAVDPGRREALGRDLRAGHLRLGRRGPHVAPARPDAERPARLGRARRALPDRSGRPGQGERGRRRDVGGPRDHRRRAAGADGRRGRARCTPPSCAGTCTAPTTAARPGS